MPTYEYECQKCGHTFDAFHGMNDKPLQRCPKCKGKLKKLLGTGAGIIFKGSGFYETDYKKKATASTSSPSTSSSKSEPAKSTDSPTKSDTSSSKTEK